MSTPVISVRGLGKQYWITHQTRPDTLRDRLIGFARHARGRLRGQRDPAAEEEFWALRDVSFDLNRGDVVGVIGRNGAGKSTLLKLISRITEPTTGEIRLRGRVASLLEVGTGFHPELTGRENIFLNGAILGMARAEIRAKFDEIVAFAEVKRFLDMQVKHYSSGMYVRLAFAVAAHLEPEILIVDEVLAVGDAAFQKKCLGKMNAVARDSGRTVLLVSHNMNAIMELCPTALLLRDGHLDSFGATETVVPKYLSLGATASTFRAPVSKKSGILAIETRGTSRDDSDLVFTVDFRCDRPLSQPTVGLVVYSLGGTPLFGTNSLMHPWRVAPGARADGRAEVRFRRVPLWTGSYTASCWLSDGAHNVDSVADAVSFDVLNTDLPAGAPPAKDIGSIHVPGEWTYSS
ncbi:MAG TPA: ABC transporter ATP-binding protein [Candidatus Didemnitutus sp.]|jgi:lipopolysaccharide transport system ATP-binding protein